MPRSTTLAVFAALLVPVFVAVYRWQSGTPITDRDDFIALAMAGFNCAAILSVIVILALCEKETNASFGRVVRANLSTIIVALIISFIGSIFNIVDRL